MKTYSLFRGGDYTLNMKKIILSGAIGFFLLGCSSSPEVLVEEQPAAGSGPTSTVFPAASTAPSPGATPLGRPASYDRLKSYRELLALGTSGKSYNRRLEKKVSPFLVQTIHGGYTELGTTELGDAVARDRMARYDFSALEKSSEYDDKNLTDPAYHLAATRFDDRVLKVISGSHDLCLGLHGFGGNEADFCIGGANLRAREIMSRRLSEALPTQKSCVDCCGAYSGASEKNPVNFCREKGIQIEMSAVIRRKVVEDPIYRDQLAEVIRKAMTEVLDDRPDHTNGNSN